MFQRKLIVSFCFIAVLAFTAGVGHASYSRVEGMNLSVPVLSQFTDDYVNIYYYPTSVVRQNRDTRPRRSTSTKSFSPERSISAWVTSTVLP